MTQYLPLDHEQLAQLCRRHHIRKLALFGSVLKGTARPDSDLDLLVEFEPGQTPGLLGLAAIEAELSALFDGRPVDLRTAQDLSRHFRDEVLRTAEVQYASCSLSFRLGARASRPRIDDEGGTPSLLDDPIFYLLPKEYSHGPQQS